MAQSPESANGGTASLWAGAEVSAFNPDYSCTSNLPYRCPLLGPGVFFDLNMHPRWGLEGEARWMDWHGYGGEKESNYLVGPRYAAIDRGRLQGWVKVEMGGGWITTPFYPQAGSLKGSYFAFGPGGELTYRVSHHWSARLNYEYQFWPSFQGPPTYNAAGALEEHNGGLTPNGFSIGVAYKILGQ